MVKQYPDKCKPSGKERSDRVVLPNTTFDPLNIEIKYPGTAILLLKSQENTAIVTAAAALSKFGSKSPKNQQILFDLNVVTLIQPLIRHEEIFIRRFATKLLAEMATLPNVRNFLLNSEYYIPCFITILLNDTDIFIHEFVTSILAELSKDMFGVAHLLEQCNNFNFLFERIQSPDPDVKKNSIEIMYNLMKDPIAAQKIVTTKGFSFSLIFELLKLPYPIIQKLTLNIISLLMARNRDENILELFHVSRGLQALLDILDNHEFYDLHQKVLEILSLACDNQKTVELLCISGGIHKLFKYMESHDKKLTLDLISVIVRLANYADSRMELHKREIVPYLLNLLRDSPNPEIADVSYYGIAKMVQYGPAAKVITAANPIQNIVGIIKNENMKKSLRHTALYCLAELLACDADNCANLLDIKGQFYLKWMIKQPINEIAMETQIIALQCLTNIGTYPAFKESIIDSNLIDALCTPFELENTASLAEFKVAYCNALSIFCIEQTARVLFLDLGGPKKLYHILVHDSEFVPVREAAARFILQLSADKIVAPLLVLSGCLEYMIKHRSVSNIVPSWEMCIRALFNSYLPAKFAFTGRLSLHDVTKDGFFIMQQHIHPFPILEKLCTLNVNPTQIIYMCNLAQPRPSPRMYSEMEQYPIRPDLEKNNASETVEKKIFSIYSTDVTAAIMAERYDKLQKDPFLYDLVKLFKCKLIAEESKDVYEEEPGLVNICYIRSRTKMLGEFVAHQMSGPNPTTKCIDHQLEIHLSEIKNDIGTNIIPLGQLRVGSYLERALLFKVIADRICLPAALVRGNYGKAWVEIALPEIETRNEEPVSEFTTHNVENSGQITSSSRSYRFLGGPIRDRAVITKQTSFILPTKLLRTNYVVDLIEAPGELIPLGTKRAVQSICSFTGIEN